jgi:hypothetical protein
MDDAGQARPGVFAAVKALGPSFRWDDGEVVSVIMTAWVSHRALLNSAGKNIWGNLSLKYI